VRIEKGSWKAKEKGKEEKQRETREEKKSSVRNEWFSALSLLTTLLSYSFEIS